jgi:hypothetical protein
MLMGIQYADGFRRSEKASTHGTGRAVRGFEPGEQAIGVIFVLAGRASSAR